MARKITYREISLALGIIVAVIVLVVIWLSPLETGFSGSGIDTPGGISTPAAKILFQKINTILQVAFR
ncbi:MAG: hypothetical protein HRU69_09465 [Flammeovirgaceae bacterium]|nr:MAG: hypothetical protein HRU69_09465 [Flammeovirgaceae bacterium]